MNLRTDFKYALVEEYKTYWNAYMDPNEFYSDLLGLNALFTRHFFRRKQQAKGQSGVTEVQLIDQNTLWFVTYGKTKRALDCLIDFNEKEITRIAEDNRIITERKIIPLK